jgi:hypothetical protein
VVANSRHSARNQPAVEYDIDDTRERDEPVTCPEPIGDPEPALATENLSESVPTTTAADDPEQDTAVVSARWCEDILKDLSNDNSSVVPRVVFFILCDKSIVKDTFLLQSTSGVEHDFSPELLSSLIVESDHSAALPHSEQVIFLLRRRTADEML